MGLFLKLKKKVMIRRDSWTPFRMAIGREPSVKAVDGANDGKM